MHDGLIDNFVECIEVDNDDNIWIGTSMDFPCMRLFQLFPNITLLSRGTREK